MGLLEAVADGTGQLVAQYRDGQDFPDCPLCALAAEIQPGTPLWTAVGQRGPAYRSAVQSVPDVVRKGIVVQGYVLGETGIAVVTVTGKPVELDLDLAAALDQPELRERVAIPDNDMPGCFQLRELLSGQVKGLRGLTLSGDSADIDKMLRCPELDQDGVVLAHGVTSFSMAASIAVMRSWAAVRIVSRLAFNSDSSRLLDHPATYAKE